MPLRTGNRRQGRPGRCHRYNLVNDFGRRAEGASGKVTGERAAAGPPPQAKARDYEFADGLGRRCGGASENAKGSDPALATAMG